MGCQSDIVCQRDVVLTQTDIWMDVCVQCYSDARSGQSSEVLVALGAMNIVIARMDSRWILEWEGPN